MTPIHVVIPTHTPRYLDVVLAGLAVQTVPPATVIVSCDTDDSDIGEVIRGLSPRLPFGVSWVRRAHQGEERLCQVRNNAVRHLTQDLGRADGKVLILDGDTLAPPETVEKHATLGEGYRLVYPYRVNVDEQTSKQITAERVLDGAFPLKVSEEDQAELDRRHRRYQKHLLLRKLALAERHKPKLLGGHFSVDTDLYMELNGFDELYRGWGFKDDEFAERAARFNSRILVACSTIPVFHLWHVTRQPTTRMADLPTYQRFRMRGRLPAAAERGIRNPLDQPEPRIDRIGAAASAGETVGVAPVD